MAQPEEQDPTPTDPTSISGDRVSINQIVAFNVRAARHMNGWTQDYLAERLEAVTGSPYSLDTVSALERTWDGGRRRQFDAQMLAQLAVALEVPIAWFFLPPRGENRCIEQLSHSAPELAVLLLGREDQVGPLDKRLRELTKGYLPPGFEEFKMITGSRVPGVVSYRKRRKELLMAMLDQHADDLDRAADEMGKFFDRLRLIGIRGLVAENTMDADFATLPEHRSTTPDHDQTATHGLSTAPLDDAPPDAADTSREPASAEQSSR